MSRSAFVLVVMTLAACSSSSSSTPAGDGGNPSGFEPDGAASDAGNPGTNDGGPSTNDGGAVPCKMHITGALSADSDCTVGASVANNGTFLFGVNETTFDATSGFTFYLLARKIAAPANPWHAGSYTQMSFDTVAITVGNAKDVSMNWEMHYGSQTDMGSLTIAVSDVGMGNTTNTGTDFTKSHGTLGAHLTADPQSKAAGVVNVSVEF